MCAGPLFIGLGRTDMRNDEAIYSYAVERMLDGGDWTTPRYIPTDLEFLEKPPLKIWLVAGLMKAGALPRNELGMRFLDAVFGTAALAYVFLFGFRLAGPACAATSLLLLVVYAPLVFDHGFRSNNMEAALVLAYAGGLWHALRWADGDSASGRHAWAFSLYFVLGFMTKYVAVLPLPAIALAAWLWRPGGATALWRRSSEWVRPVTAACLLIVPWFVYETVVYGRVFWQELLGQQVLRRMTTGVDPTHLQPWHYYVSHTWSELQASGSAWFVAAGAPVLLWKALRGDLTARLVTLWWVIPVPLLSLSHSKLQHYLFPFLPPLSLSGGLAVAACVWLATSAGKGLAARELVTRVAGRTRRYQSLLLGLSLLLLLLSAWTLWIGPVHVEPFGVRLFRNSSAVRPAVVALLLLVATAQIRVAVAVATAAALLLALPLPAYARHLEQARSTDRPLAAFTECATALAASSDGRRTGAYTPAPDPMSHSYAYYLLRLGPLDTTGDVLERVRGQLFSDDPAAQGPTVMTRARWLSVRQQLGLPALDAGRALTDSPLDMGLAFENGDILSVPPRYVRCLEPAAAAGGKLISTDTIR